MKAYSQFRPTDSKGLGLPDRQDWLVLGVARTRDSGLARVFGASINLAIRYDFRTVSLIRNLAMTH